MNKLLLYVGMILTIPLFFACGGCAMNREITLSPVVADNLPPKLTDRTVIKIAMPEDARKTAPDFIGDIKGGFGVHVADLIGNKTAQQWVQETLLENLQDAGYVNSYAGMSANGGDGELVITSTITKLSCDIFMAYNATVNLSVSLKKDKQIIFSNTYFGIADGVPSTGTPDEYQAVMNNAMRKCINAMMPELLAKLKPACDAPEPAKVQ